MGSVLAVDGGNSKTLAAVATAEGDLLALVREGGSNYQGIGKKKAGELLARLIRQAMRGAGLKTVDAACFGLAGADRDKDFQVFHEILAPIDPAKTSVIVNDTLLALRA